MRQLRDNINNIINRNHRHHVHEHLAEMDNSPDLNSNLEFRLCQLNVEKMRRMKERGEL